MVHFSECSTVGASCNTETQIEMRDGTVEHLPELDRARLCRLGVVRPDVLRAQAMERVRRHRRLPAVRQRALRRQSVAQWRHGDRACRGASAVRG